MYSTSVIFLRNRHLYICIGSKVLYSISIDESIAKVLFYDFFIVFETSFL